MIKRCLSAMCVLVLLLALLNMAEIDWNSRRDVQTEDEDIAANTNERHLYFGSDGYLGKVLSENDKQILLAAFEMREEDIYTFLQGPKSWSEGISWSGEWATFDINGNPFGGFGCGLCCLANIYNTLTRYEVSPWDMCEYAMTVTDYGPTGESGAIDWVYMKKTLERCGFTCGLYRKPGSYKEFRKQMREMKSSIVLISSAEDDTYWQDTPGHYVNIWMYQDKDETVFLAEPGNPDNNRSRVPLRYIYDALKTISKYQYLTVEDYLEGRNQWKADGINEIWNEPVVP